jgi:hypothetical protein
MIAATLETCGDAEEQKRWPDVRKYFPLYQPFWQTHVFTLRDERGRIRADIDGRLELMAQEHYKCFISVSMVLGREATRPERAFSSLQNAANRAQTVIRLFNSVQAECALKSKPVDDNKGFANVAIKVADYRNFIHEDVVGLLQDKSHRRYIPGPDKLGKYRRWSRFHNADPKDFTAVEEVIEQTFSELYRLLGAHWQQMLDLSPAMLASPIYQKLAPPLPKLVPMQPVVLCSKSRSAKKYGPNL